jgi:DivIVA domain-containing protein
MGQFLLLVVVALTVGAIVFGVTVLLTGGDSGLSPAEPDGRAVPLPGTRPLAESDIARVRFDVAPRGYRMAQVDQAMRRAAYDIGYKDELINVLEAEVDALRSGRFSDAEVLRRAREAAQAATTSGAETPAEGDQEVATINLGEAAKASTEEPGPVAAVAGTEQPAGETGQPAAGAGQPAASRADAAGAGQPAAPGADADGTEEPAGQPTDADHGGDGSGEPESDSIVPSHR